MRPPKNFNSTKLINIKIKRILASRGRRRLEMHVLPATTTPVVYMVIDKTDSVITKEVQITTNALKAIEIYNKGIE